jgi:hypothetical protein
MTKVYCGTIDCQHNVDDICTKDIITVDCFGCSEYFKDEVILHETTDKTN